MRVSSLDFYWNKSLISVLFISLFAFKFNSYAYELQPNESIIKIIGAAVIPPCHVNDDLNVDINFGISGTGSIKGGRKYVERWLPIQCDDPAIAYSVKIVGISIIGDSDIISTDVAGLGVSLSESAKKIPLNTFFKPSTEGGLLLKSQLVITENFVEGYEGEFNASATITVKYD